MRVPFGTIDARLLAARQTKRDKRKGARAGDFLRMTDGSPRRFSGDSPATSLSWPGGRREKRCCILAQVFNHNGKTNDGSYFLTKNGKVSFSGGNDFVEGLEIRDTGKSVDGTFWAWHHDIPMNGAGSVEFTIPCRLFEVVHCADG